MSMKLSFSQEVSLALDLLGYKMEMIKWRRHCYNTISNFVLQWTAKAHGFNLKPYLIGSKVEGTTVLYQSDEDYMLVCDCFLCAKYLQEQALTSDKVWIRLTESVDPGYVLLQRTWNKSSVCDPGLKAFLERFMVQHSDDTEYISSEKLNKTILHTYNNLYEAAVQDRSISDGLRNFIKVKPAEKQSEGSSYKLKIRNHRFTFDFVLAFPCIHLEFMSKWAKRERKCGWPTADRISKIMRMCAHIVPKSSKNFRHHHVEFRICHTFGEIELVKSLSETQIKLYVLLKELFKSEFELKHPDIMTSYVLKNVVFWLCERTHIESFKFDLLLQRLVEALKYIHASVSDGGIIPNYFIPKRNLLDGQITPDNQSEITSLLSSWISEGENVVFKIKNVHREVLYVRQDIIQTVLTIQFRNLCEMYFLNQRRTSLVNGPIASRAVWYLTDATYKYIEKHCFGTRRE